MTESGSGRRSSGGSAPSARAWAARTTIGTALLRRAHSVVVATIRRQAFRGRALRVNLIPVPVSGIGVTLYHQRVLGCSVSMRSNLDQALVAAATAAAGDRRFPRITAARLRKLRIVVSVLYHPRHLGPCRKVAVAQHLRLGTDSLAVSNGKRLAIFLDYVAPHQSWTAQQLVTALLRKARLRDSPLRWTTYRTASWPQSDEGARALVDGFSPVPQRSANQ
jgi:hypothetical protein